MVRRGPASRRRCGRVWAALRDSHATEISRRTEALERVLEAAVMIMQGNLTEAGRAYIKTTARAETAGRGEPICVKRPPTSSSALR